MKVEFLKEALDKVFAKTDLAHALALGERLTVKAIAQTLASRGHHYMRDWRARAGRVTHTARSTTGSPAADHRTGLGTSDLRPSPRYRTS